MTKEELVAKLESHHNWRSGDGVPHEILNKAEYDPYSLTEEEQAEIDAWRDAAPCQLRLVGLDLSGMDLSGMDFTMVSFEDCKLCECDLRNAIFDHAILRNVCLEDSNLIGASLDSCRMVSIDIGNGCSNITSSKNIASKLGADPNSIYQSALADIIAKLS